MKKYIVFLSFLTFFSLSIIAQQSYDRRGIRFDTVVDFTDVHFETAALFDRAQFDSTTLFARTNFKLNASFTKAQFHSKTVFDYAHFHNSNTNFSNTHFDSSVSFHYAKFYEFAGLTGAKFQSTAYFGATLFDSIAYFRYAVFHDSVNFEFAKFHVLADFVETKFDSVAIFHSAQFHSKSSFRNATLPYLLDLSNIDTIKIEIDFTSSKINSDYGVCKVNLVNANIDKITFKYSRFELYFPDSTDAETKATVYEKLLLKQKKEGFIKSYEKLDKEYKEFWYLEGSGYWKPWGYFQNWINKFWWGYGYNKIYIVYNTLLLFLLFALINTIWFKQALETYEADKLMKLKNRLSYSNRFCFFLKKTPLSFFYTSLIFFGLKFSIERLNYQENLSGWRIFRLAYFFIIFITGLICLGYLANFVLSN